MTEQSPKSPQFFMTAPAICPYLEGREERKVFTYLNGPQANELNMLLTLGGFRRSQTVAYRPICHNCKACVSVRIPVSEFVPDRTMKRIAKANADIIAQEIAPRVTQEQYELFRTYLDARHFDGGMAGMTMADYVAMVEDSAVDTRLIEYRIKPTDDEVLAGIKGELVGVALTDVLADGYSMVYSFYDPQAVKRSLGTVMILDHITKAKELDYPYVYLGYWVEGSRKMQYKMRFQPLELLGEHGWQAYVKD